MLKGQTQLVQQVLHHLIYTLSPIVPYHLHPSLPKWLSHINSHVILVAYPKVTELWSFYLSSIPAYFQLFCSLLDEAMPFVKLC